MTAEAPRPIVFSHVAVHEAGHVAVLKAALGVVAPPRPVDMHRPEPRAWDDVFTRLAAGEWGPVKPTRVAAFLFGGVEALVHAARLGPIGASRYHGLHGADGSGCDGELIDRAVMEMGADRWRAVDLARAALAASWPATAAMAREIAATGRIDPAALRPLLDRVAAV